MCTRPILPLVVLSVVVLPGAASAATGWHIDKLRSESHQMTVAIAADTLHCGEEDIWGQSYLDLEVPGMARFSALTAPILTKLFEGPCDDERQQLIDAAGTAGKLVGTAKLELYEYVSWGILDQGGPFEREYCDRILTQDVDFKFKNGPGEYSVRTELWLAELPLPVCVDLYGEGDGAKTDELPGGNGGQTAAGCSMSGSARGGIAGSLLLLVAFAAVRRRR